MEGGFATAGVVLLSFFVDFSGILLPSPELRSFLRTGGLLSKGSIPVRLPRLDPLIPPVMSVRDFRVITFVLMISFRAVLRVRGCSTLAALCDLAIDFAEAAGRTIERSRRLVTTLGDESTISSSSSSVLPWEIFLLVGVRWIGVLCPSMGRCVSGISRCSIDLSPSMDETPEMSCVEGMANDSSAAGSGSSLSGDAGDSSLSSFSGCLSGLVFLSAAFCSFWRSFLVAFASGTLNTSLATFLSETFIDLRRDFIPDVLSEPNVVGV